MDTIITLSFLFLGLVSFSFYLRSPGNILSRLAKGATAFFCALISIGSYVSGDYAAAFPIIIIIAGLTFRRAKLTKEAGKKLDKDYSHADKSTAVIKTNSISPKKAPAQKQTKKNTPPHLSFSYYKNIRFGYTDSNGELTYRDVDVSKVDIDYITGFCHLRRQIRTFRIDRLENEEVIVRDSGEVLNVYDWITLLYPLSEE